MSQERPTLTRKNLNRMSAASPSVESTQAAATPAPGRARVLAGSDTATRPARPSGTTAPAGRTPRPQPGSGSGTDTQATAGPRAQGTAVAQDALPRWAKGVVIGGVLLAVAMPASVLLSRSMLVQSMLAEESNSNAAMVCTSGDGRARTPGVTGWLFGGSYFQCNEWETREARQQRERDQYEANYLAKERAKQGLH